MCLSKERYGGFDSKLGRHMKNFGTLQLLASLQLGRSTDVAAAVCLFASKSHTASGVPLYIESVASLNMLCRTEVLWPGPWPKPWWWPGEFCWRLFLAIPLVCVLKHWMPSRDQLRM